MSSGDDYKEWQDRYNELNDEAWENKDREDDDPDKWDATRDRDHTENMRDTTEQWVLHQASPIHRPTSFLFPHHTNSLRFRERAGREEARDDHGEDADEGHDDRIEKLKDREQLLSNKIGHLDGEYEYTEPMQDADENARQEAEEENEKRWQQQADAAQGEDHEENSDMDLESGDDWRRVLCKAQTLQVQRGDLVAFLYLPLIVSQTLNFLLFAFRRCAVSIFESIPAAIFNLCLLLERPHPRFIYQGRSTFILLSYGAVMLCLLVGTRIWCRTAQYSWMLYFSLVSRLSESPNC